MRRRDEQDQGEYHRQRVCILVLLSHRLACEDSRWVSTDTNDMQHGTLQGHAKRARIRTRSSRKETDAAGAKNGDSGN